MFITIEESFERAILRENEYESVVRSFWNSVHKNSVLHEWKPLVTGPLGSAKPDAIIFFEGYQSWGVVEFELASHATSHFDGQFAALESADWSKANISKILDYYNYGESKVISRLVRQEPPSMICISDGFANGLMEACRAYSFHHMVISPYLSRSSAKFALKIEKTPHIFRVENINSDRIFRLDSDLKFVAGKVSVSLPMNFPNLNQIRLLQDEIVHVHEVVKGINVRRLFLEPSLVKGRKLLNLAEIDPLVGLFTILP